MPLGWFCPRSLWLRCPRGRMSAGAPHERSATMPTDNRLNGVEIEIDALTKQCLDHRFPDEDTL